MNNSANNEVSPGKAISLNNATWLLDINYINFIRDIGRHFSVNTMLRADCYKQRLEEGLTFLEMNYMLMQSYDFMVMARDIDVRMQFGGNGFRCHELAHIGSAGRIAYHPRTATG